MSTKALTALERLSPREACPESLESVEERELVARLRCKENAAIESFVYRFQDQVFTFCDKMLNDREEASDASQEIFLSVLQNIEKFREDSKFSTWVYRVAKNHCVNRLKYLQRRGRGKNVELLETDARAFGDGPEELLQQNSERLLVQRGIEALDEQQRMLIILRDLEGLSYDEIVDITDLPEGTVKSRLHRAREKLALTISAWERRERGGQRCQRK